MGDAHLPHFDETVGPAAQQKREVGAEAHTLHAGVLQAEVGLHRSNILHHDLRRILLHLGHVSSSISVLAFPASLPGCTFISSPY